MVTVPEIRAARALVGWTQDELAARLGIGVRTLKRIELGDAPLSEYATHIEQVFGAEGVDFLSAADDGIGVRQRRLDDRAP